MLGVKILDVQEPRRVQGEKLLLVLFFTLILSVMNATMFNIALPIMKMEFGVSSSVVGWVLSGYIIVYAIGSVTFGKLADMFPLRRLLLFGLLFVAIGSLLGLFAQTFWMVMCGRILQAVGASVIPAVAMIIPVRYFPADKRGRAMGMVATGLSVGTAIGPIVAGLVADVLDWRWLFLLPALMLLTLPFYYRYLQDDERKKVSFDWIGGGLLAATIVSSLLAVTTMDWRLVVIGLLSALLLVRQTNRSPHPFITRSLFANRQYRLAIGIAFATTGTIFIVPFMMPLMLNELYGFMPLQIGLILFPGALIAALLGRSVGRLTDERGSYVVYTGATVLMASAFALLSVVSGVSPYIVMLVLMLTGIGQVGVQIALSNRVSATLPKESVGLGMGMFSMLNFISGATATTFVSKALDPVKSSISNASESSDVVNGAGVTAAMKSFAWTDFTIHRPEWVVPYSWIFIGIAALLLVVLSVHLWGNRRV
jgi:DHA2 family metal-tetracycline-proton antiporter-like MFS transporter